MALSEEEQRERHNDCQREWYYRNIEKRKAYNKKYYEKNKERLKESRKEYHKKRKELHPDYHKEYSRAYGKKQRQEFKRLRAENKELKRDLEHRDTILSIMYDLVRDWYIDAASKLVIIKAVVDIEAGEEVTEFQTQLAEMFYHRGFLHMDID